MVFSTIDKSIDNGNVAEENAFTVDIRSTRCVFYRSRITAQVMRSESFLQIFTEKRLRTARNLIARKWHDMCLRQNTSYFVEAP